MRKTKLSIGIMILTLLVSSRMVLRAKEPVVEAKIVTVERADVHQVIAVTGIIAYEDERMLYAASNGTVEQVYIEQGRTVAQGDAVIKLNAAQQESILSAAVQNAGVVDAFEQMNEAVQEEALNSMIIRSKQNAVVRQLFVQPDDPVYAGMPVARMTSNRQIIQCTVVKADGKRIKPGMWAWLKENQEVYGFAVVEAVEDASADQAAGVPLSVISLRPEQHIPKREGEIVDAEIYLAGSDDVLSLPLEAVTERGTVWQFAQGRCLEIPAGVILCDEINAWVSLPEGMQVAIGEFYQGQRIMRSKE